MDRTNVNVRFREIRTDLEEEATSRVLDYLSSKLPLVLDGTLLLIPSRIDNTSVTVPCGCGAVVLGVHKNFVTVRRVFCSSHGDVKEDIVLCACPEGGIAPVVPGTLKEVYS